MFSSVACLKGPSRSSTWGREKGLAEPGREGVLSLLWQANRKNRIVISLPELIYEILLLSIYLIFNWRIIMKGISEVFSCYLWV